MKKLTIFLVCMGACLSSCIKNDDDHLLQVPDENIAIEEDGIRSYEEALNIAEEAIDKYYGEATRSGQKRRIIANEGQCVTRKATRSGEASDEPIMYIFNNEDNEGFTIVAANENVSPIIAVTESGNYTYGEPTGVEPFDLFMEQAIEQYSLIVPPIGPITPQPIPLPFIDTVIYRVQQVEPLLVTNWGQNGIYGKYCPNGLSGCSNTAAVQIMAYHQYPETITITYDGTNRLFPLSWTSMLRHTSRSLGFKDSNYEYACNCGCAYNSIATIMREIGKRANTRYLDGKSPADEGAICNVLRSLGYSDATHVENIDLSQYKYRIYDNLTESNPIFISGFEDYETGHAWVIDGYDWDEVKIDYYIPNQAVIIPGIPHPDYVLDHSVERSNILLHFNWGWYGLYNGWYNFGCLNVSEAVEYDYNDIGYDPTNYNLLVNLVYNIDF